MSKPIVAIVGRPNVGKSTLFNALAGEMISIVKDTPGVTRDRIYAEVTWLDKEFTMIDTGGIEPDSKDIILSQMREQAQIAIDTADVIIFITDVHQGLVDSDAKVADMLRRSGKPVVLVVNKVDSIQKFMMDVYEFYSLGLGDPVGISAVNRLGFGELLDRITEGFPARTEESSEDIIRTAIVGRPNVGKSTLINSLLGYQRSLVADEMGTTRDAVDSVWKFKGKTFVLVDTAGMRKKSKIDEPVEKYSVIRSIRAIDNCDVAIFILDAEDMLTEQDKKIIGYIHEAGKGLILFVNKWDTIEKGNTTNVEFEKEIRKGLPFASYAPVLFGSALTKQRIHRLGDMIYAVAEQASLRVPTAVLNDLLEDAKMVNPPPAHSGRVAKIYYMTQVGIRPPTFVMFVNDANLIHFSYVRFMENRLREAFSFEGTPIRIVIRSKKDGGDD